MKTDPRPLVTVVCTLLVGASACANDVAEPYDLTHPRILAVRATPPAVAADESATIEVLLADSDAVPRVAIADAVTVSLPASLATPETSGLVRQDADAWRVTAPPADAIAALRASLGLDADQPLVVPLAIQVDIDGIPYLAQKSLLLGETGANPDVAVEIGEASVAAVATVSADADVALRATASADDASFRWFSSIGDVSGFATAEATLEAGPAAQGHLAVVVRDGRGGVGWRIVEAHVE